MSIGTRNETSLHRELKFRYAGQDGETEAEVAGFVADGINAEGEYIEIQTGSFGPLRKKALALRHRLRVIHPVIITKYIEVYNKKGKLQYRRKSPRKGGAWDLFNVLVYAPDLPLIPGLVIELALVDAAERRVRDGKGSWRRRGISIRDRQMLTLHDSITLEKPSDYFRFVPFKKNEKFTSALLAQKAGIPVDLARKTLYVLVRIGIIEKTGKQGNSLVYVRRGTRGKFRIRNEE
jgi:stalled ribosome alternative rescue factor ArfA